MGTSQTRGPPAVPSMGPPWQPPSLSLEPAPSPRDLRGKAAGRASDPINLVSACSGPGLPKAAGKASVSPQSRGIKRAHLSISDPLLKIAEVVWASPRGSPSAWVLITGSWFVHTFSTLAVLELVFNCFPVCSVPLGGSWRHRHPHCFSSSTRSRWLCQCTVPLCACFPPPGRRRRLPDSHQRGEEMEGLLLSPCFPPGKKCRRCPSAGYPRKAKRRHGKKQELLGRADAGLESRPATYWRVTACAF